MNATLNTFPPLQSMNSPRGWILAAIVLLHFGFFLLLSSGMGARIVEAIRPPPVLVIPKPEREPTPPPPTATEIEMTAPELFVPRPDDLPVMPEDPPKTAPRESVTEVPPNAEPTVDRSGSAEPVLTGPEIDPRVGLSEPLYPAASIREGHTGTVVLSVYVLENGRVGQVRLDQSSGYPKLDESALREARRWQLRPGMRDGVPIAMWKQIPITFRLQGSGSRRF